MDAPFFVEATEIILSRVNFVSLHRDRKWLSEAVISGDVYHSGDFIRAVAKSACDDCEPKLMTSIPMAIEVFHSKTTSWWLHRKQ